MKAPHETFVMTPQERLDLALGDNRNKTVTSEPQEGEESGTKKTKKRETR